MIRPYDKLYSSYNTDLNNNFLLNKTGIKDYLNNKNMKSTDLKMTDSFKLKPILNNNKNPSFLKEITPTFNNQIYKSKIENKVYKPTFKLNIKDNVEENIIKPYETKKIISIGNEDNNLDISSTYKKKNIQKVEKEIQKVETEIQKVETEIPKKEIKMEKQAHKEVILFYADWCGYSKQFYPIWEKIKNNPRNKKYNFREMESKNRDIMKYNIRAFPTILFVDHSIDFKILYSGNRTEEDIEVFLYKVFNTEKKTNKELTELDITNIELKEIPVETKNPFSKIIKTGKINLMTELNKKINKKNENILSKKSEEKNNITKLLDLEKKQVTIKPKKTEVPVKPRRVEVRVKPKKVEVRVKPEKVKLQVEPERVKVRVKPGKVEARIKPKQKEQKIINLELDKENGNVELVLFYADWCGYSKKFLPIWESIIPELDKRKVGHRMVDSTKKDELKKYNIDGFPTLIYIDNVLDIKILYDGVRNKESILTFIDNILNNKKNNNKEVLNKKTNKKIILPEFKPKLNKNNLSDVINKKIDNVLMKSETSYNKMDKTSLFIIIILSFILLNYTINYISNLLTDTTIIKDIDDMDYFI